MILRINWDSLTNDQKSRTIPFGEHYVAVPRGMPHGIVVKDNDCYGVVGFNGDSPTGAFVSAHLNVYKVLSGETVGCFDEAATRETISSGCKILEKDRIILPEVRTVSRKEGEGVRYVHAE